MIIEDDSMLNEMTCLMNQCWREREVPSGWHVAAVSAIFKNSQVDLFESYRPISLLAVGYKIFASLVRSRLVEGGAEN